MKTAVRTGAVAMGVAAALTLAACGSTQSSTPTESPTQAETLRVAMSDVTTTLDPAKYNVPANFVTMAGTAGYLISHPYQDFPNPSLYDGDQPVINADEYEPELATDWSLSDDGLTLTMNLREGVMSPYGNELTADDLLWTVQRNQALTSVGNFGMTIAQIDPENPLTVVDDYTVEWNLLAPSPLLLKVLAWSWFAPFDSTEAKTHATADDEWATAWLTEHSAFYGPYNVTQFTPGESVTLSVNENYWDTAPAISTITMQAVPDAGNRQQLVQRGEVDFVADIPRSQLTSLQNDPSVQVLLSPALRFSYLQYNVDAEPLGDALVRQALSYAIPYDQILTDVYRDTALAAPSVGTWLPGTSDYESPFTYDIDKARELLAEAGVEDGFTVNLLYSMSNPGPENEQAAVLIADSFKDIGVTVNLQKPSSEADFTTAYNEGNFQMAIAGLAPGAPDLGYALYAMGYSAGYQNFGNFADAEYDEVLLDGLTNPDETERAAAMQEGLDQWADYVPSTTVANPLVGVVASPKFGGLRLGVWAQPFWKYATLSE